jgi:hypothetical protein
MPRPLPYALRTEEDKEAAREAQRRYRAAHPEKVKAQTDRSNAVRKIKYHTDPVFRESMKARSRAVMPAAQRERRAKLKAQVFDHYGRMCACCGETETFFLTLGHVNGDGAAHRNRVSNGQGRFAGSTSALYLDIIRRGFPKDIRIECYNCNCGAFRNGGVCPHVKLRQAPISNV